MPKPRLLGTFPSCWGTSSRPSPSHFKGSTLRMGMARTSQRRETTPGRMSARTPGAPLGQSQALSLTIEITVTVGEVVAVTSTTLGAITTITGTLPSPRPLLPCPA